MKVWQIVDELEQIYLYHSYCRLKGITSEGFRYVSDFEDIPPLTAAQYEEYLKKQLRDFYYPNSLEILEKRANKTTIEMILQKDMHTLDHCVHSRKLNFYPFLEPRLLQCRVENGKITEMHLCAPENKKIPENIQAELLECCKRNDLPGAAAAIRSGAYAADCEDEQRFCLEYAAESGSVELCRLLIEDEADIQTMGWNAIFYAVKNPDAEVLRYLLRQGAPTDVIKCPARSSTIRIAASASSPAGTSNSGDDLPMTPLDYARYLRLGSAEKILVEFGAPTFDELKEWCFKTAGFRIPLSEEGGEMSIGAVGDEINEYAGLHIGNTTLRLGMELEDCCALVIPFFIKYFPKKFEPYLEDNLVTFDDARKSLREIEDFIGLLENDFDDPKVTKVLSSLSPGSFIEWGERNSWIILYFSKEEDRLLWKAHRGAVVEFYRELHAKMNAIIAEAKNCGDKYISFVGP